jgi:3-oxoacyl-[acyl-carrier-protein] synthase II
MTRGKIVITGIGAVTPVGDNVPDTWRAVVAGESGISPVTRFDAAGFPVTFAAEIASVEGCDEASIREELVEIALGEALEMSGDLPYSPERIGVCIGAEAARPALDLLAREYRSGGGGEVSEYVRNAADAPARSVAKRTGAKGPCTTVSTACTSSSQAVGEGLLRMRRGEVDAMIVGGVDALVGPLMVTGFSLLGALSTRNDDPSGASRPFDIDRDGFVLGEGAGFLVLEREDAALARGAEILAELSGFGCSCNAWRITDSPPDGRGAAQAIRSAIADAGLEPTDIGYINAHGTSTPMNDPSESRAINQVFGEHRPYVSSTKSSMGHLVAACGAVEAVICVQVVRHGVMPPTINLHNIDPECDLNHVQNIAKKFDCEHALTNAFGFGGSNGSLIISRWRSPGD